MVRGLPQRSLRRRALIDRLVHHADIIPIKGESYRRKEAQERTTASRRKTPRAQP
jgi:DNA replication protein DnaC